MQDPGHRRPTRSTSPRTAGASPRCWTSSTIPPPERHAPLAGARRWRWPPTSATRCSCALLRAGRPRDGDRLLRRRAADYMRAAVKASHERTADPRRPASWRTRSRSTSTPSATARTSSSAGSWSTSRRPASTPATPPASCPPHSLPARDAGDDPPSYTTRHGPGARRRGPDERPVRDQGRASSTCSKSTRARRAPSRSSRKATGVPLAKIAVAIMLGETLAELGRHARIRRRCRACLR